MKLQGIISNIMDVIIYDMKRASLINIDIPDQDLFNYP